MGGYILGIGVSVVDIIGRVLSFPKPDSYTLLLDYDRQVGGTVSNALVSLSRLGVKTRWLGKVGNDEFRQVIIDDMQREGVEFEVDIDMGNPSPLSIIIVDSQTGARSICYRPGCSFAYGKDFPAAALENVDILHLDGFFIDAAVQAARQCKSAGVKVSLDAEYNSPELLELVKDVDILIPNLDIAMAITGEHDVEDCLRKLADLGPRTVVITSGAAGSWGYEDGRTVRVEAVKVDAVDTTGCGDAYHGGFLFGELKGWELESKMLFASAYSALKATRLGGRKGLPDRAQMLGFLREKQIDIAVD